MQALLAIDVRNIDVGANGSYVERTVLRHVDVQVAVDTAAAVTRYLYLHEDLVAVALQDELFDIAAHRSRYFHGISLPALDRDFSGYIGHFDMSIGGCVDSPFDFFCISRGCEHTGEDTN